MRHTAERRRIAAQHVVPIEQMHNAGRIMAELADSVRDQAERDGIDLGEAVRVEWVLRATATGFARPPVADYSDLGLSPDQVATLEQRDRELWLSGVRGAVERDMDAVQVDVRTR